MPRHVLRLSPPRAIRLVPLVALLAMATAAGQESVPVGPDDDKDARREQRLEEMRRRADRFKLFRVDGEDRVALERMESPLMRFGDAAREFHDATLWAWGEQGRPRAVLTLEQYGTAEKPAWWYELVSLSDDLVAAEGDGLRWEPASPGVEWLPPRDSPDPADSPAARLRQMKDLARRLAAHEIGRTGQRYELRLLSQPIHRYEDPDSGLADGAVFVFAYGTNPELLLLIEAQQDSDGLPAWRCGFARTGAAELHVSDGDTEVWFREYARQPTPRDPYIFFSRK